MAALIEHGGRLRHAAQRTGIAVERWLDLSTGINPLGWRGGESLALDWQRLPDEDDGLAALAARHYGASLALPVAGSQAAIQWLPRLRTASRVGVMAPAYAEHALRWRLEGHPVEAIDAAQVGAAIDRLDVLVVINPNNPTGQRHAARELLAWHARLAARGSWLIVDEAFADAEPADSLAADSGREGLIVLRSLGKFYGLAGARVGFVLAAAPLLARLAERIGPWTIAGPARALAAAALADQCWATATRERLAQDSRRLAALLCEQGLPPAGGCALFQWVYTPEAENIAEALARQAILVRRFAEPASLRFGLPGAEADWQRLAAALRSLRLSTEITA